MGRKKVKFGKRINVYLSNETIKKVKTNNTNISALVERLILEDYEKKRRKMEEENI